MSLLENGVPQRIELFDPSDWFAADAQFEEWKVGEGNAASESYLRHLRAIFDLQDAELAMAELADDIRAEDRRPLVAVAVGKDQFVANWQRPLTTERPVWWEVSEVHTFGDRVAVIEWETGPGLEFATVAAVGDHGLAINHTTYGRDQFDEACAYAHELAGAVHEHHNRAFDAVSGFWRLVLAEGDIASATALNDPDCETVDRRRMMGDQHLEAEAAGYYTELIQPAGTSVPHEIVRLAIDGNDRALIRLTAADPDGAWAYEVVQIIELGPSGLIRRVVTHSSEDEAQARAEFAATARARSTEHTPAELSNAATEWAVAHHEELASAEVIAITDVPTSLLRTTEPQPMLHVVSYLDDEGVVTSYPPERFVEARADFHERTAAALPESQRAAAAVFSTFGAMVGNPDGMAAMITDDFISVDHGQLSMGEMHADRVRDYQEVRRGDGAIALPRRILDRSSSAVLFEHVEVDADYEWRRVIVMTARGERIDRLEIWDADAEPDARARFEELRSGAQPPTLSNEASEWARSSHPELADAEVLAIADTGAALLRSDGFHVVWIEPDGAGAVSSHGSEELHDAQLVYRRVIDARLPERERATAEFIYAAVAALNDPDRLVEFLGPNYVTVDHRTAGMGSVDREQVHAYREAALETRQSIGIARRVLGRHGDTILVEREETDGEYEWRYLTLLQREGDLLARIELWDPDDEHAALTRFGEVVLSLDAGTIDPDTNDAFVAWFAANPAPPDAQIDLLRTAAQLGAARGDADVASALVSPDFEFVDRRTVVAKPTADGKPGMASLSDEQASMALPVYRTRRVLALSDHALLLEQFRNAQEYEWQMLTLLAVHDGQVTRLEGFDVDDEAAALARFEELSTTAWPDANPSVLRNRATRSITSGMASILSGEEQARGTVTDDFEMIDRRALRVLEFDDPDRYLEYRRSRWNDVTDAAVTPVAIRGERLAVIRYELEWEDDGLDTPSALTVFETDDRGRAKRMVVFDITDVRAALDEMNQRYVKGEGAPYREVIELASALGRAQEVTADDASPSGEFSALLADGCQFTDHRRLGLGRLDRDETVGLVDKGYDDAIAGWATVPTRYLRIAPNVLVVERVDRALDEHEGVVEWQYLTLVEAESGRARRIEFFDADDELAAIARFVELTKSNQGEREILATRGERLTLARVTSDERTHLLVAETDSSGTTTRRARFESDDESAAHACLDEWYVESLGDGPRVVYQGILESKAALAAGRTWSGSTGMVRLTDHRAGGHGTVAGAEWKDRIESLHAVTTGIHHRILHVHRLGPDGSVVDVSMRDADGNEWRTIEVAYGLPDEWEVHLFHPEDLADALDRHDVNVTDLEPHGARLADAQFDAMSAAAARPEGLSNAASEWARHHEPRLADAEVIAVAHDLGALLHDHQEQQYIVVHLDDAGLGHIEMLATRDLGEAVDRYQEIGLLLLSEWERHDLMTLAIQGANAGDPEAATELLTDDYEYVERRVGGLTHDRGAARPLAESISELGGMVVIPRRFIATMPGLLLLELLTHSGGYEWHFLMLYQLRDGRVRRQEIWDLEQEDAALARFEELAREMEPHNAASDVFIQQHVEIFDNQDLEAGLAFVHPEATGEDRRSVITEVTITREQFAENYRQALDAEEPIPWTSRVLHTIGDRIAVVRLLVGSHYDWVTAIEIDGDGLGIRAVNFDHAQLDDALAEAARWHEEQT